MLIYVYCDKNIRYGAYEAHYKKAPHLHTSLESRNTLLVSGDSEFPNLKNKAREITTAIITKLLAMLNLSLWTLL